MRDPTLLGCSILVRCGDELALVDVELCKFVEVDRFVRMPDVDLRRRSLRVVVDRLQVLNV